MKTHCYGPDGSLYQLFAVDYKFQGRVFSLELWARDWHEARARVRALRKTAGDGEFGLSMVTDSQPVAHLQPV